MRHTIANYSWYGWARWITAISIKLGLPNWNGSFWLLTQLYPKSVAEVPSHPLNQELDAAYHCKLPAYSWYGWSRIITTISIRFGLTLSKLSYPVDCSLRNRTNFGCWGSKPSIKPGTGFGIPLHTVPSQAGQQGSPRSRLDWVDPIQSWIYHYPIWIRQCLHRVFGHSKKIRSYLVICLFGRRHRKSTDKVSEMWSMFDGTMKHGNTTVGVYRFVE